jgi:hypothetical protein
MAKQLLATVFTLFLSAGLVSAQVCNVSCAFQGCQASAQTSERETQSAHCQQHESAPQHKTAPEPRPDKSDHSSECQTHAYAAAMKPSSASSIATLHPPILVPAALPFTSVISLDQLAGNLNHSESFRSPPARVTTSVLRI